MAKLQESVYLVLTPTKRAYREDSVTGVRAVTEFAVDRKVKNRPITRQGEIAVKVNLTIDASLFDKIAPVVDVELEEGDLFANVATQVSLNAEDDSGN